MTRGSKDPQLLAHAVEMTRYASERAAAHGEAQYQGFFDSLPVPGSAEYGIEWTDILITRMVMKEAEDR